MSQPEVAMLILQGGQQRWPLEKEEITLGRGPDCDIILPDRVVSRHHAVIQRREGRYFILDQGSKNGTFINGEPVDETPRPLTDGDEIQIALRFRLTFVDAGATAPLTLESPIPIQTPPSSGLRLDDTLRTVSVGGRTLSSPLSVAQYRLLRRLIQARGAVVSRDEIIDAVWPEAHGAGVSEQAIDALVRRLRERLAELDPDHQYIVTVRGHGFRLENPET